MRWRALQKRIDVIDAKNVQVREANSITPHRIGTLMPKTNVDINILCCFLLGKKVSYRGESLSLDGKYMWFVRGDISIN